MCNEPQHSPPLEEREIPFLEPEAIGVANLPDEVFGRVLEYVGDNARVNALQRGRRHVQRIQERMMENFALFPVDPRALPPRRNNHPAQRPRGQEEQNRASPPMPELEPIYPVPPAAPENLEPADAASEDDNAPPDLLLENPAPSLPQEE